MVGSISCFKYDLKFVLFGKGYFKRKTGSAYATAKKVDYRFMNFKQVRKQVFLEANEKYNELMTK